MARKAMLVVACLAAFSAPLLVGVLHARPEPQASVAKPPATPTPLVFEAVSIKPIVGLLYPGVWARPSGSRLSIEAMTVGNLITWAYGVKDYQVIGGPAWTGSEQRYDGAIRYNIEAKADGEETRSPDEFHEMMKAMLANRFQLILHHEQRTMPVYALVVDKGGPKFKESGAESPHSMTMHSAPGGSGIEISAEGLQMNRLAGQFSNSNGSDRPVIDETGLNGFYDFTLDWDIPQAGRDSSLPAIFTAMRDQLGLRMAPKMAPFDVLVIDRVEKPSEN
jgi:uncharacterized protein (TIGR03435 family)